MQPREMAMQPIEGAPLQGIDFRQLASVYRDAAAEQRRKALELAADAARGADARKAYDSALRHAAMLEHEANRYDERASALAQQQARLRLVTDNRTSQRDILIVTPGVSWPPARQEAP